MKLFDPMTDLNVAPLRFWDNVSDRQLLYVYPDTDHWTAGWLCYKHPDGQWVTLRKATDDDIERISNAVTVAHHTRNRGGQG